MSLKLQLLALASSVVDCICSVVKIYYPQALKLGIIAEFRLMIFFSLEHLTGLALSYSCE